MKDKGRAQLEAMRFVGVGFSFLVEVGVFAFIGYWLDGRLETGPWLLMVGVVVGMTYAIWHLLRTAAKFEELSRQRAAEEEEARDDAGD